MNHKIIQKHPIHILLDDFFVKMEISDVIAEYQRKNSSYRKWLIIALMTRTRLTI